MHISLPASLDQSALPLSWTRARATAPLVRFCEQLHARASASNEERPKRFGRRLLVGLWTLVLAISMTGWLVALGWIAFLLIRRIAN